MIETNVPKGWVRCTDGKWKPPMTADELAKAVEAARHAGVIITDDHRAWWWPKPNDEDDQR